MKNLTIQHLAPYLPYGLNVKYNDCIHPKTHIAKLSGVSDDGIETTYKRKFEGCRGDCISFTGRNNIVDLDFKPILRPLSDLTKEIEHNGERFVPIEYGCNGLDLDLQNLEREIRLNKSFSKQLIIGEHKFKTVNKLFQWHFDVFGLIEQDLAIDINTIQK